MIRKNVGAYQGNGSVELREFPGRSHFICNQDGWEDVADFALDWIGDHLRGA